MSNFVTIPIVFVTLFVMIILIVDHVEVSRSARRTQESKIQEWEEAYERLCTRDHFKALGITDPTREEIHNTFHQTDMITKILKTM